MSDNDKYLKYMSDNSMRVLSEVNLDGHHPSAVLRALVDKQPEMMEFVLGARESINLVKYQQKFEQANGDEFGSVKRIIKQAIAESYMRDVEPWHLLLACYDTCIQSFSREGITRLHLLRQVVAYIETVVPSALDAFCVDLTAKANEMYDPIIGRDKEIEIVTRVLSRRTKPNVALIGEPGVGKSAIAVGFSQRIANGNIPDKLKDWKVYYLDLALLSAGASMAGEFERRVVAILDEIRMKEETVVLFIDELHRIVGAGGSGSQDAANMLKPALARGDLHVIGATTLNEYREFIEKDGALERRFQALIVQEPTVPQTIEIVDGVQEYYARFHGIQFEQDATAKAVELAAKYILQRRFPDKALDIIDEAASIASLAGNKKVTADDMCVVVSSLTGIPTSELNVDEKERLANIETYIHRTLIGQNDAVEAVSSAIRRSRTGLDNGRRPIGSFLFLGPTGVGKTELAKTLADFMFGSMDAVVRLDMSEFQEHHTVSRLFGSPPGYVGYNQGGQLTEAVRRKPYSVVLFDEIEKAHTDIFNVLLQILDEGRLTDSGGRVIDFTNTIIIMTSNIAPELWRQPRVSRGQIENALLKVFRPEFINRVDDLAVFKHLTFDEIMDIATLRLNDVAVLAEAQGYSVRFDDAVRKHLAEIGFHEEFGARPLNRAITNEVSNRIAHGIACGDVQKGGKINFSVKKGNMVVNFA